MLFFLKQGLHMSGMNLSHLVFVKFSFLAIDDVVCFHVLVDFILVKLYMQVDVRTSKFHGCAYTKQNIIFYSFVKLDIPFYHLKTISQVPRFVLRGLLYLS